MNITPERFADFKGYLLIYQKNFKPYSQIIEEENRETDAIRSMVDGLKVEEE